MKPVLFQATATSFISQGIGTLDCQSCIVTEERNGVYELEMKISKDALHFDQCVEGNIIVAIHDDSKDRQAFQIYKRSKEINGIVTVNAEHISYRLSKIVTMPFRSTQVADALQQLKHNAAEECPFEFWTDKQSLGTFEFTEPCSIRSRLGGTDGSILDAFGGGEYEFDNFTVKLRQHRGSDNGITLRKGKNLTEYTKNTDISGVYTAIVPYAKDGDDVITLPEKIVRKENAPTGFTVAVDLSGKFDSENPPTVATLRAAAMEYVEGNAYSTPLTSAKVSFVALWQTEEYKNIAPLQRVRLCDTVTVVYDKGDAVKTKVVKTIYNVLLERYDEIQLGEATTNMSDAVKALTDMVKVDAVTQSQMEKALEHAAELMTGGLGGFVVFERNANGEPQEILIMDTDDKTTAVNAIRINKNGIAFSQNGYNGPFVSAWTIDGQFVADFITVGTLDGSLIRAGSIEANMLSVEAREEFNMAYDWAQHLFTDKSFWKTIIPAVTTDTLSLKTIAGKRVVEFDARNTADYTEAWVAQLDPPAIGTKWSITITLEFVEDTLGNRVGPIMLQESLIENNWTSHSILSLESRTYTSGETVTGTLEYAANSKVLDSRIILYVSRGSYFRITELTVVSNITKATESVFRVSRDGFSSYVKKDDVISSINQSPEAIKLSANKIGFAGENINMDTGSLRINTDTGYMRFYQAIIEIYEKKIESDMVVQTVNIAPIYRDSGNGRVSLQGSITLRAYDFYDGNLIYLNPISSQMDGEFFFSGQVNHAGRLNCRGQVLNSSGGVQFVSDNRAKNTIEDLEEQKSHDFIMGLRPRKFKYNEGTSDRFHHGFIAQEVHDAMTEDWGVYTHDEEEDMCYLRYDEIISDLVKVVQEQERRIKALEERGN